MNTIPFAATVGFLLSLPPQAKAAVIDVDPERSRIQVDAKATGHAFTGDLNQYTIKAEGDVSSAAPTKLELVWDFNDLKTGDGKRDVEMIKWLGGGKPKGSFTFDKAWDVKSGGGNAQGTLTINGVSKVLGFSYKVKREGDWVTLDGDVKMDYQNFKLPVVRSMLLMTVDPNVLVRFHLVGKLK